jgi:biopolymer transport protein ExbD
MLDMAFQLLAFFVMTFQAPTAETRIDLDLPAAPTVLPPHDATAPTAPDVIGLETDLRIVARADEAGRLESLLLQDAPLASSDALGERLRRYAELLEDRPLRVTIAADDRLRYEEAARLIGACSRAGVVTIRLAPAALPQSGGNGVTPP